MVPGHPLSTAGVKPRATLKHTLERGNQQYGFLAISEGRDNADANEIECLA